MYKLIELLFLWVFPPNTDPKIAVKDRGRSFPFITVKSRMKNSLEWTCCISFYFSTVQQQYNASQIVCFVGNVEFMTTENDAG